AAWPVRPEPAGGYGRLHHARRAGSLRCARSELRQRAAPGRTLLARIRMADAEERVALIEIVERDGRVRQQLDVRGWPLSIGRALDRDLVLDDPHVAAEHATL